MTDIAYIGRTAMLILPAATALLLEIHRKHSAQERSAALFSGLWAFLAVTISNIIAVKKGLVSFNASGPMFYGTPVDLMLSFGFISGVASALIKNVLISTVPAILWCIPVYYFSTVSTDAYELLPILAATSFLPASLLAKWTRDDTHIYFRSFLQSTIWCVFILWLFPSVALIKTASTWDIYFDKTPLLKILHIVPLILPSGLIINALYVFAKHGNGTAFPYDPPKKLVDQGIYSLISNPMQTGICLALFFWGLALENLLVTSGALIAFLLFIVFRKVCNGSSNLCSNDPRWEAYQKKTPRWVPKVRK